MTKFLLLIIALVLFWFTLAKLTNYDARMDEYNAHVCAVNGYMPDCKTPLQEGGEK